MCFVFFVGFCRIGRTGRGYLHYFFAASGATILASRGHALHDATSMELVAAGSDELVAFGEVIQADGTCGLFNGLVQNLRRRRRRNSWRSRRSTGRKRRRCGGRGSTILRKLIAQHRKLTLKVAKLIQCHILRGYRRAISQSRINLLTRRRLPIPKALQLTRPQSLRIPTTRFAPCTGALVASHGSHPMSANTTKLGRSVAPHSRLFRFDSAEVHVIGSDRDEDGAPTSGMTRAAAASTATKRSSSTRRATDGDLNRCRNTSSHLGTYCEVFGNV